MKKHIAVTYNKLLDLYFVWPVNYANSDSYKCYSFNPVFGKQLHTAETINDIGTWVREKNGVLGGFSNEKECLHRYRKGVIFVD